MRKLLRVSSAGQVFGVLVGLAGGIRCYNEGTCTEIVPNKSVLFTCHQFRLGNRMMLYWNARALAFLEGLEFRLTAKRDDLVQLLPNLVLPSPGPSSLQKDLWLKLQAQPHACYECPFPHGSPYSPWRLIGDVIFRDTLDLVNRLRASDAALSNLTSWSKRTGFVVFHWRCDDTVFGNEQYGFLPHRFIGERLPPGTTDLLVVGQAHAVGRCAEVLQDLTQHMRQVHNVGVSLQESTIANDWATLATAPVLFCMPSTFCLTAGLGNPNTVYFPNSGFNMAVRPDGEDIKQAAQLRSPRFHFVPYDYLPGPAAAESTEWEPIRMYLNAFECDPWEVECVPVGGRVPQKYMFHQKES